MHSVSFPRLAAILSAFVFCTFSSASPGAGALWIAESEGVLKVATDSGETLFEIPDAGGADGIAIDNDSGRVWTIGGKPYLRRLKAYDADGAVTVDMSVPQIHKHTEPGGMLADGHGVWLAADREVFRFDAQGQLQNRIRFRHAVAGITLDSERSHLWVAVPGHVFILDRNGNDVDRFRTFFLQIDQLDYDETLDGIWAVVGPYLLRLDAGSRDLAFVSTFGVGLQLRQHLSADGRGGVWGATSTRLSHVNAAGLVEFAFKPFQGDSGKKHLQDLVADRETGSVWLANQTTLKQYDIVGAQQLELIPDLGDGIIRFISRLALAAQTRPPEVEITLPAANSFVNTNIPTLELHYIGEGAIDTESIQITHNSNVLTIDCTAAQTGAVCALIDTLPEGEVTLEATIADSEGNVSEPAQVTFTVDTVAPAVTIGAPQNGAITNMAELTLDGNVSETVQTLTLNHNGEPSGLQTDSNNVFSAGITLSEGSNALAVNAVDRAGNTGSAALTVTLDTVVPAIPDLGLINISRPDEEDNVAVTGRAGSAEPGGRITITNIRTGESVTVTADAGGAFSATLAAQVGDDIQITVSDAAGNSSQPAQAPVTNLPPDPATVAPPLNPTQITPLIDATAFLYTGGNPIQTGVQAGTIEARRVAVIRGQVLDKQNNPLPGVTVTVKDHPEFGQTLSRADGMFDLAVNGGGSLTLNYEKADYLPVQRQVNAPWQDYVFADDIVMIQLDPQVTIIDLNSPTIQVAQGTPQTDEDGTRQATILFPPGTTATMTLPDGTTQPLTTMHVRATEYTVGENGPEAMPAELPPASGYTYAVELSVDEAIAANASKVVFNQPVPLYVDNFLNFPTGEAVPTGYYDRDKAAWIPGENGRVIGILSIENNLAVLDVDGSGNPADSAQLAALGITADERQQLAALYQPGKTLWRSPITHFTPWDCNWPTEPPKDAEPPPDEPPETPDENQPDPCDESTQSGCVIGAQSQTLGEEIPLTGTPFTLHYWSDRVAGRKTKNTVSIPLSGASIPGSVEHIDVSVEIAGRRLGQQTDPQTGLSRVFEWDGLDGFGRPVYGSAEASITVSYVYRCVYRRGNNGFGRFSSSFDAIGSRANCRFFMFPRRWTVTLESPLTPPVLVAGLWSLDVHHAWEQGRSRLLAGNGRYRPAPVATVHTIAGGGASPGDGGPATQARLIQPRGVTLDAAGNVYIADWGQGRIRRVGRDGVITTVAGGGSTLGDDGPATQARLNSPNRIAVDAAGNLYIADTGHNRIRRVNAAGIITTVAGSGSQGFSGDGGPATEAALASPSSVAVDAAGNLYIGDSGNHRVRQVDPSGIITTVAGTGASGFSGDGGPAALAQMTAPRVHADRAGNLYITANDRVRRIGADGVIATIAGGGSDRFTDGIPATEAWLVNLVDVEVDAQGNLYLVDGNHRIRKVGADGLINTIAGTGVLGFNGDGGPVSRAQFSFPSDIALDAEENLYIADSLNSRIRFSPRWGLLNPDETRVASADGSQLFVFDSGGRHLRSLNALTGAVDYAFGRDGEGRLIGITDIDGDVTAIERDNNGKALAIVAPDGQRTQLTVDANGHLVEVTNPAGETYRMQYTADGLMTEFRDRKNQPNTFHYDELGRLTQDINAGLGGWTLDRTEPGEGYQTIMTTAEGRELAFSVEPQANGDRKQINTQADGSVQTRLFKPDGEEITTQPDGTQITLQEGPDPRFSMQSPLADNLSIQTPGGLASSTTTRRNVILATLGDPLSLESLTETTAVNGREFITGYDAATKTFTFTSPEGRTGTQTINEQGRPISTRITGLAPVDFGYDMRGRLERIIAGDGSQQRLTQLSYYGSGPQAGFLQSIVDAENRTVKFEYDNAGRVTRQILPDSREIQYGYDANDNITSITPPGRPAHIFNYNAFDLEDQYSPPDVAGIANPATVYDYNLDKELIRITRPDGQEINFNYNSGAQLTSMLLPTGTYGYTYLPASGQLDTITSPDNIVLDYNYDGFLLTGQNWTGDVGGSVTQSYNNNLLISQRCVNTNCISFSYDNDNMLTNAGSLMLTRDPQRGGLITGTAINNVTTGQDYNTFGELESFDAQFSNTQYFHTQYTRDKLGRITQKTEVIDGETITEIYDYDQAGRLETVTRNGIVTTYAYDSNGNRLSKTSGTVVENGIYDDQDRLLTYDGCSYEYTDNGELKTKICGEQVTEYDYDLLGNLLAVKLPDGTHVEYVIEGQNRRIGKKVNGMLVQGFLYADQLNPIVELNPDGSIRSRFVYGTRTNVPDYITKDGIAYRIISDHLGSPRLVINAADGSIAQRMDYDEFGNVTLDTNPGLQPFGFAGGIYDLQTGLVRFGVRDYDSNTGRWTAKDPVLFDDGFNLYSYTFNDPINFYDLTGKSSETPDPNGIVPGGPWTPAGAGQQPGTFYGPQQSSGPRAICRWVPPENSGGPNGSQGYWKTKQPGQRGWSRFSRGGTPITANQAHPGKNTRGGRGGGGRGGGGAGGGNNRMFESPFKF